MHIHIVADETLCIELVDQLRSLGHIVTCGETTDTRATWIIQHRDANEMQTRVLMKLTDTLKKAEARLCGKKPAA